MKANTHLEIDATLCGVIRALEPGRSTVELVLREEMKADALGLVHGGFLFTAADYAAMLAVNDPNVVLGAAEVRFSKPSRVGDTVVFDAKEENQQGRKRQVTVTGRSAGGLEVFSGRFTCFVLDRHVLQA